jgi:hypothetical protein
MSHSRIRTDVVEPVFVDRSVGACKLEYQTSARIVVVHDLNRRRNLRISVGPYWPLLFPA